ncbi:MAG: zinc-dependent peptidase [Gammaproteobacteria bacterium]|nr:zinc-dependent peptidase [Gammaproteobacteria bacterium]
MTPILIIGLLTMMLLLWPVLRRRWRERRRARLRHQPFPAQWSALLRSHAPLYNHLPSPLREHLHGHIQVLLAEKDFHGAGGLVVTDAMRLIVAAQAALLLLNRPGDYFPDLYSIVLHPAAFVVNREHWDAAGLHHRERQVLSGESWGTGQLVLSWDDSLAGGMACGDGYNVVLHEFAHQLDLGSGAMNGTPRLDSRAERQAWAAAFTPAFADHCARVEAGEATWLDPYAASEPAEFFAVLTEAFFELPEDLAVEYPAVYACLRTYYRVDPRAWKTAP